MSEDPTKPQARCPGCGAALLAGPEGRLCARCLLALAIDDVPTPPGDAPSALAAAALVIGKDVPDWIGPYHLLSVLGSGGMGLVFLAEQELPLRRRVALKLVKRGMDSKEILARFESERQALALMSHPGIAKVFDAGTSEDGLPYFVMEHVAGIPITEYCDRNRLSARQRLELFVEVCEAVQHAHTKGIIHRDIKPSNVLVSVQDSKPQPKVIDFGVAKAVSQRLTERTLFTQLGVMIGTPGYMSPEQAEATSLDIDTRSDIYSLGVLVYELLVGELPFDAKRLRQAAWRELQRIIQEEEPPKPSARLTTLGATASDVAVRRGTDPLTLARELRGDLDWITLKALEKDRTRRYQTASELAADVRRHFRDEPVTAGPPGLGYRLTKAIRRHKLLFGAGTAVAVALAVGLAIATTQYYQAEAARRETRQQVVHLHVKEAMRLVDAGDRPGALPWLVEALRLDEDAHGRQVHRHRIGSVLHSLPLLYRLWTHGGNVADGVFSPDGKSVASASADRTAQVWNVVTGEALSPPLHHDGAVRSVAFSPDGKRVVTASTDGAARIWDVENGRTLFVLRHGGPVTRACFAPQGTRVLTASSDGTAAVWAAGSGKRELTVRHAAAVLWAAFSPDGHRFLTTSRDGTARVWNAETGQAQTSPLSAVSHPGGVTMASFSADGTKIVTVGYDRYSRVWSATTGALLTAPLSHRFNPAAFADFSPDGRLVAVAAGDNRVYLWGLETATESRPPLELSTRPWVVRFSPDGLQVVAGDAAGLVHVWRAQTGELVTTLRHSGDVGVTAFDATGRFLLTGGVDGTVRVWDLAPTEPTYPAIGTMFSNFIDGGQTVIESGFGEGFLPEGFARVWDVETGDPKTPPLRHAGRVVHVVSRDDRLVATAGELDRTARLWDRRGEPTAPPMRHDQPVWQLVFSPDARRLVTAGWGQWGVRLWNVPAGTPVVPAPLADARNVTSVGVTPDGRHFVTGSMDGTVQIWDSTTGSRACPPLKHPGPVSRLAISSNGQLLATVDSKSLGLWTIPTGQPVWPTRPEVGGIEALAFAQAGDRLVTGTRAGNVTIWDALTGRRVGMPMQHQGWILGAAFSKDGQWLITASMDRSCRVWNARTGEPVTPAYQDAWPLFSASLSPDGRRVLTTKRLHEFRADSRPERDLEHLAQLLAGYRLQGTGTEPLSGEDLKSAWAALRSKPKAASEPSPLQVQAWHRERAAGLLQQGRWPQVLFHLDRALETGPRRWRLLNARAHANAELERWTEAANDFTAALEMIPGELEPAYALALLHLLKGDRNRFDELRDRLVTLWADTRNPDRSRWAAHALVLAPIGDAKARAQAVSWSEAALEAEPERAERLSLHGAALFRAGRLDLAVRELEAAIRKGGDNAPPSAFAFLALAEHSRGGRAATLLWREKSEAARRRYREPSSLVEKDWQWTSALLGLVAWEQRIELRVLAPQ